MSTANDILDAVLIRCQTITVTGGFNTDIGIAAQVNEPVINPEDVTDKGFISIFDTTEENIDGDNVVGDNYMMRIDLTIEAHIRRGLNNAVTLAHEMIDDIKTGVMLSADRTLTGVVLDLRYAGRSIEYPQAGGDIVSVQLNFYTLHVETYGDP